ncbi:hypothetical protein MXB_1067 [Myxobolus squamalis]|nr:hypothetical protein MXB_1067 [Myxobolus squamalis]
MMLFTIKMHENIFLQKTQGNDIRKYIKKPGIVLNVTNLTHIRIFEGIEFDTFLMQKGKKAILTNSNN